MQKLEMIKNSGQTTKSSKSNNKSKVSSNFKKTAKSNVQFSEIFGQISSSLQSVPVNTVKQTSALQPESKGTSVKTVKSAAVGVRHLDSSTKSAPGKTEGKLATIENLKQLEQIEKAAESAGAGEMTTPSDTNQLISSPRKIQTNTGSKLIGMEKAALASTNGKKQSEATSDNMGTNAMKKIAPNEIKSTVPGEIKSTAPSEIKPTVPGEIKSTVPGEIKSMAPGEIKSTVPGEIKSMAPGEIKSTVPGEIKSIAPGEIKSITPGEIKSTAPGEIKLMAPGEIKSTAPGEIKIADLILASNNSQAENTVAQTTDKKLPLKPEVSTSAISSARIGSDILVKSQANTNNGDKEGGSETPGAKTPTPQNGIAFTALTGENRVVELDVSEFNGINSEKNLLSRNQTDLLVSKMIEQIKVAPSSLEVSLKPEYLGKINILVTSNEGLISVNIIAKNGEAMSMLNSNLQSIKDNLEQQGIRLDQMDVNLANQEKQNNQGGSGYREQLQAMKLSEKANLMTDYANYPIGEQTSSVSYEINILA